MSTRLTANREVKQIAQKRYRFAQRRKAVGYSQEQLAEQLGVDRTTVIRWEAGETEPQPWQWPNLATALKISATELTGLLSVTGRADIAGEVVTPTRPPYFRPNLLPSYSLSRRPSFSNASGSKAQPVSPPRCSMLSTCL